MREPAEAIGGVTSFFGYYMKARLLGVRDIALMRIEMS